MNRHESWSTDSPISGTCSSVPKMNPPTVSQSSFGNWFEDVRALGFLRPPWGLAYDGLIAGTTSSTNS